MAYFDIQSSNDDHDQNSCSRDHNLNKQWMINPDELAVCCWIKVIPSCQGQYLCGGVVDGDGGCYGDGLLHRQECLVEYWRVNCNKSVN